MRSHRERPTRRRNPSGKTVFVARWTDKKGERRIGYKPEIPGTFVKRGPCREPSDDGTCCAQHAIDRAYELDAKGPERPDTFGGYAVTWIDEHPRSRVTNRTNKTRLNAVLDIEIEEIPLAEWPLDKIRRRQVNRLVDYLLVCDERAYTGVNNILSTLSAMYEDALDDEAATANPFKGAKWVKATDPRIVKARRPVRVFSWEQMHAFARACAEARSGAARPEWYTGDLDRWRLVYAEPMIRTLGDCGLRAGELLPLFVSDLDLRNGTLEVRRTQSTLGEIEQGTKTDHGEPEAGRTVPLPPALWVMLKEMPKRIDAKVMWEGREEVVLFPSPRGKVWRYQGFWASVWEPGREVAGLDMRPHEMRHSWVSQMRAAGVDVADLADASGHTVDTATRTYTHSLGRSFEAMRAAVGE